MHLRHANCKASGHRPRRHKGDCGVRLTFQPVDAERVMYLDSHLSEYNRSDVGNVAIDDGLVPKSY